MTRLHGVDVSNHQGMIDWDAAKNSGLVDFAIIKTSEGTDFVDDWWVRNVTECRRLNIPLGTYHYTLPSSCDAVAEAQHYVRVRSALGVLPGESHWGDHEDPALPVGGAAGSYAARWRAEVRRLVSDDSGVYTYPSYITERNMGVPELADAALWYASYDGAMGPVPAPWPRVAIWQYTAFKSIAGIGDRIDCNWFEGTVDDFRALGHRQALDPAQLAALLNAPDPLTGFVVDPLFSRLYDLARHGRPLAGSALYTDGTVRQLFENCTLEKPATGEARVGTGLGQALAAAIGHGTRPDWPDVHPYLG